MGKFDLPIDVHEAVCFYCRSYHRREYIMREVRCTMSMRAAYSAINNAILEGAGLDHGEIMRKIIIEDIGSGRGWSRSPAIVMLSEKAYKNYKREAKWRIAHVLGLL